MSAFTDFPYPENFPAFLSHHQLLEYLRMYTKYFDLQKYIQIKVSFKNISWMFTLKKIVHLFLETLVQWNSNPDFASPSVNFPEQIYDFACSFSFIFVHSSISNLKRCLWTQSQMYLQVQSFLDHLNWLFSGNVSDKSDQHNEVSWFL